MKKLLPFLLLTASICSAADVRFTWLLTTNMVPGLPTPPSVQYGAEVFMNSDNPKVTEFLVTVVAQMPNGEIVTRSGTAVREASVTDVPYSTVFVAWFGPDPNFQVLSIEAKAMIVARVTKPFPGRDYLF
jgi:hypothetical protein